MCVNETSLFTLGLYWTRSVMTVIEELKRFVWCVIVFCALWCHNTVAQLRDLLNNIRDLNNQSAREYERLYLRLTNHVRENTCKAESTLLIGCSAYWHHGEIRNHAKITFIWANIRQHGTTGSYLFIYSFIMKMFDQLIVILDAFW